MERSDSTSVVKFLVIVVIIALFLWIICPFFNSAEHFDSAQHFVSDPMVRFNEDIVTVDANPLEFREREIPVVPAPSYDAYTHTVQAGSEFIPQKNYFTPWGTMIKVGDTSADGGPNDVTGVTGVADNTMNFNQCSPACCSAQWPVPFKMPVDKMLCNSEETYVPTSYFCNNGWQDSGCLCMTKDQSDFLQTRGQNTDF